ncbi:MAG: CbtA family protein [Pseudomonadota bacterium]
MLTGAVFAGFAAGLLAALLHFAFVQKFILLGEQYESGAQTHFAGVSAAPPPADDGHGAMAEPGAAPASVGATTSAETAPAVEPAVPAPAEDPASLARNSLTVLFASLIYVGYALLLTAAYALADRFGHRVTAREGVLWGIAGFAMFQLAPALGLAPNLPGIVAAAYEARLVWWWGTVLATGTGLALLAFGRGPVRIVAAVVLLAAPHLVGAPQPDAFSGVAPPEVAAGFSARVIGVSLTVWAMLGWLSARLWAGKPA